MEQRTDEWYQARLGKLTASRFNDIVKLDGSPRTGDTPMSYLNEKVYELLNDRPLNIEANKAMQWGTDNEDAARLAYEDTTFDMVQEVGFVTHGELDFVGASCDGLVGDDGGIEIKCPYNSVNHIKTLTGDTPPTQYKAQIQGNIWLNNLNWLDYVSFDPRMSDEKMQIKIIRCYADPTYLLKLWPSLVDFWGQVQAVMESLKDSTYKIGGE